MKKNNNNYFVTENFKSKKIIYGFFSKVGGYSTEKYHSLNCSINSDDDISLVQKNINIAKKNLGLANHKLKFLKQIHSNKIEIIDKKNLNLTIEADGSITKESKIALAIMTADCAPIFIYDSDCSFICSLHAGWKGCLKNIVKIAIDKINKMHIKNNKLIAIIGPCLSKENFEVDISFKDIFLNQDLRYENFFTKKPNHQKIHFDMRGLINYQLQDCSVENIANIQLDTYTNENLFFSHRKSFHKNALPTGRMINMIGFKHNE